MRMTFQSGLILEIRTQYMLRWNGIHGITHWARVLENGRRLAPKTGANLLVVELFALFHDAGRLNEGTDYGHGVRGAQIARSCRGRFFDISDDAFRLLEYACSYHTDGETDGDITVRTCWDADRLDLGRVGKMPRRDLLCTEAAKDRRVIAWANRRAVEEAVPAFAREWLAGSCPLTKPPL